MDTNSEETQAPSAEPDTSPSERAPAAEPKIPSPEQSAAPAEEPIILKKLFPTAEKDLDSLFPDAEMKKLLKDLVRTRQKNDRFLKKIDLDELPPEED